MHQQALLEGRNWIVTPQGGMVMRQGMKYVGAPFIQDIARVFQFHQGGDVSDIIVEVTAGSPGKIRFWRDGAIIQYQAADIELDNEYTQADLDTLYFTNQENLGVITHARHPPKLITLEEDGNITAADFAFGSIPITKYNDAKSPSAISTSATYDITFSNYVSGDQYTISYDLETASTGLPEPQFIRYLYSTTDAAHVQDDIADGLSRISSLSSATINPPTGADPTFQVVINGQNVGKIMTFKTIVSAGGDGFVSIANSGDTNLGEEPAWSFPYIVQDGTNYFQCIVPHKADAGNRPGPPGTNASNYWTDLGASLTAYQQLAYDYQHGGNEIWVVDTFYAPYDRGFPRVCQFHEQRLILASIPDAGTTLWGSRIGNYTDFIGGPNDSDPIEFSLDSSDTPTIKWMRSQQDLLLGTSAGDWQLTAQVTLGPTDIQANKQNNARSHNTLPVVIDNDIFYVEQGRSKVRASGYVRDDDSFSSTDISVTAEHLFHEGIIRIVLVQTPETMLYGLREDGQLLALAYERNQGVAAWTEIETSGAVIDMAGSYSVRELSAGQEDGIFPNEDGLYLVVLRSNGYAIEHMPYTSRVLPAADGLLSARKMIWMDAWLSGEAVSATTIISGLTHLEGLTVGVLINDAWQIGEFVVTGGQITVDEFTGYWAVGLLYTATGETFEHAEGNPSGTALGTNRRWSRLYVRTVDSALPIINNQLPPDRTPAQPMDIAEIIRRGIQTVRVTNAGFGEGRITLVQDRPYPTQVVGLFGEFESGNA